MPVLGQAAVEKVGENVGSERDWFGVLRAEEANVEQALVWAGDDGDTESLLRLATGMFQFWQASGALTHGRRWLAAGLERPPDATSVTVRMGALWAAAWLAYQQGDDDDVERAAGALDALATAHGDTAACRNAATVVGMLAVARDQAGDAIRHLTEAVRLASELGRPWFVATSQLNLAAAHLAAGDAASARPLLVDALQRYDALGDRRFHARVVGYLALTALVDRDLARATTLYQRSLAAFRDLGEPKGTAEGLAGLANVAAARGDVLRAATLAGAAERINESVAGREFPLERRIAASHVGQAAAALPPEDWATAWATGRALDRDDAIDLALRAAPLSTG
jgi:tetratricopeptide (TPR) repeat protein